MELWGVWGMFTFVNNIKLLFRLCSFSNWKENQNRQIWPSFPLEYLLSYQKPDTDSNTLLHMKLRRPRPCHAADLGCQRGEVHLQTTIKPVEGSYCVIWRSRVVLMGRVPFCSDDRPLAVWPEPISWSLPQKPG